MKQERIPGLFLFALSAVSALLIVWWLTADPSGRFSVSLPGTDNRNAVSHDGDSVVIGNLFERFTTDFTPMEESWPRFRGAFFDNISRSAVPLKETFGGRQEVRWSVSLGEGHSGAAIYKGLVYLLDYMEEERADFLRCFSLATGKELWRRGYQVNIKRNHGMSRTVPAVTDSFIVTIGPRCHVMCISRASGDFLWGLDIEREYRSEVPLWYTGQCPLIDGDIAVLATGGKALMVGIDLATGSKVWETPNPNGWKMSHSSVMPYEFGGRKMYVYSAAGGMAGIAADGDDKGNILWETSEWNKAVVAPSPLCMPDGKIFITAGYGAGSMMFQLKADKSTFSISLIAGYKPGEGLACEQQTSLYWSGHLFGIMPKDGGALRNQLICVNPSDTRKPVWSSGPDKRFGLGPYLIADNKMFLLHEDGTLFILKPSLSGYIESDRIKLIPDGQDAWAPLAIADGMMVLRDSKTMICIDLKK